MLWDQEVDGALFEAIWSYNNSLTAQCIRLQSASTSYKLADYYRMFIWTIIPIHEDCYAELPEMI
jgi:hypothetical protein